MAIEVEATNRAPIASAASVRTPEDTPIALARVASDADDDRLRHEIVTEPRHGTPSGVAPDLTCSPAPNFHGPDAFSFRANDGQADFAPVTVTIDVQGVNDAPTAKDVSVATDSRSSVVVALLERDVEDDPLTYRTVSEPGVGKVSIDGSRLVYRPDRAFGGPVPFAYVATDGEATSAPPPSDYVQSVLEPNAQRYVVPDGFEPVAGADAPVAINGLYRRVRDAIERGGDYAAPETERWHRRNGCAGWDGRWYRRGYYDDGTPLGSATSEECRIDSIGQSWSVLSRAGDPARSFEALDAVMRELVDPETGLVRLFTPPFAETDKEPRYIEGSPPGVRENGGQYIHAGT